MHRKPDQILYSVAIATILQFSPNFKNFRLRYRIWNLLALSVCTEVHNFCLPMYKVLLQLLWNDKNTKCYLSFGAPDIRALLVISCKVLTYRSGCSVKTWNPITVVITTSRTVQIHWCGGLLDGRCLMQGFLIRGMNQTIQMPNPFSEK